MKIKKVDITGFRAYEKQGDGTFDFTINTGEVADFVSIFAPNGFGKSSFYDAIEWAITNNISRYTRDSLRSNNDSTSLYLNTKRSGQSILRNRYISDSDPTNVLVETTSTDPFKRELRKAANGRRDFKFDPKDTDPATKHLIEIFLSQDAIDSFLKEEKPESRYEKFMSNFGGEDEEYRLKINALLKTCMQEIKGLKQEELRLQEVLKEPIHKQGLQHINDTIHTLCGFGENLEFVDNQYSLSIDLDYKNNIAIKRQKNLSNLELLKEKKFIIDECLVGLEKFFRDKNQELNLRKRLFSLESNRLELDERNKFIASVSELESKLGLLVESIAIHNIHKSNLENYNKNNNLIKEHSVQRSNLINESNALKANLISNQQRLEDSIVAIKKSDHNFNKSKEDLSNAQNKFSKITSIESELFLLEAQLEAIKDKLVSCQSTIHDRKKEIEQTNNLEVSRDLLDLSKFNSVNISNDLINKLVAEIDRSNSLKSLVDKYLREQNQLGDQQDSIVQLVSMARELITHTKSEHCPLCSHKYDSYQILVERILNNKGLSLQQKKIEAQIEDAESELILLNKSISESIFYIENQKNKKIKLLELELNKKLDEQDSYVLNLQSIMLNIKKIRAELVDLKTQTLNLSFTEYVNACNQQLQYWTDHKAALEHEFSQLKSKTIEITQRIEKISPEVAWFETSIQQLRDSELVLTIEKYLTSNSVLPGTELDFFNERTKLLAESMMEVTLTLEQSKKNLAKLEQSIIEANRSIDINMLMNDIHQCNDEILKLLSNSLEPFQAKLQLLQPDLFHKPQDTLELSLNHLRSKAEETINICNTKNSLFDLLTDQLNDVLPFLRFLEANKALAVVKSSLDQYLTLESKLREEFDQVEKRLKNRIDNFFYIELINKIYSKIDPHPSFKTITFVCLFPENEKPRLEIYLHENEDSVICPTFYFSAAQLNILSLSIFLARALHVEHEGRPVETILIDDPIHSMDSINILSTIDLLRNISTRFGRQIILSTHDENFYELLKVKLPSKIYRSKFMKLESFGKISN